MKLMVTILLLVSCSLYAQKKVDDKFAGFIQSHVFSLSKVMMHDVVNPPAASRYYAYCLLGAYEIVSQNNASVSKAFRFIKNYKELSLNNDTKAYDYKIAALFCILETGKQLLPSGYLLQEEEDNFIEQLRKGKIPQDVIDSSFSIAQEVVAHIIKFSRADHYNHLSARIRYTPLKGDGYWYPTPPMYMEAVEPNWKIVRPLVIDSCNEFIPPRPVPYNRDSSSEFYKLAKEVYDISIAATPEQIEIASFWDCNPFAVATSGHLSLGFKRISPGGHWMNIAGIVSTKASLYFDHHIMLQTFVAITLMDAFISCWDEKYRSNRIRPETFINRYIDVKWQPLLQTPPFPEYPSGHSVISTASAEVLTYLLGDGFSFVDDSEMMFDISPRLFTSFRQAAEEAAISRLYGGIHFRDAIINGQEVGKSIGNKIIAKLKAAGIGPLL